MPQGQLIPPEEESFNHSGRVCRIGPDNKLYITLGQPFNVQPRDKLALYNKTGIGGIVRMNQDGTGREVYATGVRNSVGMDFNPKDKTLWFTDNQTDGMGDDIPMGEINRATQAGQFFGYPYIVCKTRITEYGYDKDPIPAGAMNPQVMTDAHAADLGMTFYTASNSRRNTRVDSSRRSTARGTAPSRSARACCSRRSNRMARPTRPRFSPKAGSTRQLELYRGRPVDVQMAKDGSLLVSDDYAGAIYRITYSGQ